jgi:hypothetical protein
LPFLGGNEQKNRYHRRMHVVDTYSVFCEILHIIIEMFQINFSNLALEVGMRMPVKFNNINIINGIPL